ERHRGDGDQEAVVERANGRVDAQLQRTRQGVAFEESLDLFCSSDGYCVRRVGWWGINSRKVSANGVCAESGRIGRRYLDIRLSDDGISVVPLANLAVKDLDSFRLAGGPACARRLLPPHFSACSARTDPEQKELSVRAQGGRRHNGSVGARGGAGAATAWQDEQVALQRRLLPPAPAAARPRRRILHLLREAPRHLSDLLFHPIWRLADWFGWIDCFAGSSDSRGGSDGGCRCGWRRCWRLQRRGDSPAAENGGNSGWRRFSGQSKIF
ncbi:unnamed protein product, partial [Phaeothamnion confervicola]